jgi:mannose-6-phosphate isomerase-like protein (cupin superfamily)
MFEGSIQMKNYVRPLDSTAGDWIYSRVVVGTNAENEPYFARDEVVTIRESQPTGMYAIWGGDSLPTRLPADGKVPDLSHAAPGETTPEIMRRASWLPKTESTGYRVFWYEFGPRYKGETTTACHWHDSTEIWSIAQGEVVIILANGHERTLKKGESIVVTGIDHRWENRSGKSAIASVVSLAATRTGAAPATGDDLTKEMTAPER